MRSIHCPIRWTPFSSWIQKSTYTREIGRIINLSVYKRNQWQVSSCTLPRICKYFDNVCVQVKFVNSLLLGISPTDSSAQVNDCQSTVFAFCLHLPTAYFYCQQKRSGDKVEIGHVFIFSRDHTTKERAYFLLVNASIILAFAILWGWLALPFLITVIILAIIVSYLLIFMYNSFKLMQL